VVAAGPRAAGGGRAGAAGRLAGGLAWGLGGAAVGGAGAGLLLLAAAPAAAWPAGLRATLPTFVAFTLAFAPFAAVGAFLAARRPRHSTGWLFLAIGLLSGASALANGWRAYAPGAGWGAPPALVQWLAVGGRALLLQGLAAVVLGFPDGRLPAPRWRPAAWLIGVSLAADLAASALAPHRLFTVSFRAARDTAPAGAPAADGLLGAVAGLAGALAGPLEAAVAVVAAAAVLWRLRRARGTERRQLQWLAYCVALAAAAFAAHCAVVAVLGEAAPAPPFSPLLLAAVLLAGAPVAVAVAVARDGLYHIEWLLNRTLVYVPLTAILAGLYAAAVVLFQRLFLALTGAQADAALVLSTLVLAAAFTPLKNALQGAVDARFKTAPDPAARLRALGEQVRADFSVVDPRRLAGHLLEEAAAALRAPSGAVYLTSGGRLELVRAVGGGLAGVDEAGAGVSEVIERGGARLGLLRLGPRADGHPYALPERDALREAVEAVGEAIAIGQWPAAGTRPTIAGARR
jgi:hypothetical protein